MKTYSFRLKNQDVQLKNIIEEKAKECKSESEAIRQLLLKALNQDSSLSKIAEINNNISDLFDLQRKNHFELQATINNINTAPTQSNEIEYGFSEEEKDEKSLDTVASFMNFGSE